LTLAFLVLTLDFVLLYGGLSVYDTSTELLLIAVAAAAALTAFVAHEMAHKVSAQRRGYWAEFRLSVPGLLVSVVTAVLGFLFAAPGATMIGGTADQDDMGRISLAGPATNFVFSLGFLAGAFVAGAYPAGALPSLIFLFLAYINAWFAAFNMIPIGPLRRQGVPLEWRRLGRELPPLRGGCRCTVLFRHLRTSAYPLRG